MKRKRLIPKAWMKLRECCGSAPMVTYHPDMDVTAIQCEECGLFAVNCYDDEVIEHWNGQIGLTTADEQEKEMEKYFDELDRGIRNKVLTQ
jgi:hypothetical protein